LLNSGFGKRATKPIKAMIDTLVDKINIQIILPKHKVSSQLVSSVAGNTLIKTKSRDSSIIARQIVKSSDFAHHLRIDCIICS
jgi:hypothetical protein